MNDQGVFRHLITITRRILARPATHFTEKSYTTCLMQNDPSGSCILVMESVAQLIE